LGPFADLDCAILFTKTAVFVIHPDSYNILKGWHEPNSPCLWQFPLQANTSSLPVLALSAQHEEPGPRRIAANFLQPPPTPSNSGTSRPVRALFDQNDELGPRGSAANFFQLPPVTPNQVICSPLPPSIPLPVPCTLPAMACVDQFHPFHGFHATTTLSIIRARLAWSPTTTERLKP
jgi:hypothetical protein